MTTTPQISLVSTYHICAGHRLSRPDWTPEQNQKVYGHCANNHGHQYKLELTLTGNLSADTGMLINGYDVDAIVQPFIKENFDHKFLNDDVVFFKEQQPTAEWIAVWVFRSLKSLFPASVALKKVRIYETPELAAEYAE